MKRFSVMASTRNGANTAIDNCVSDAFANMMRDICKQLNLDFRDFGWDVLSDQTIQSLRAEVSDYIVDLFYKRDIR